MRRSWTIGLLSMLGLGLAFSFSCAKNNDDDDDTFQPTLTGGAPSANDDDDSSATDDDDDSSATDDDDDSSNQPESCGEGIEGLVSEECLTQVSAAKAIPVNMMMVIDKSGSMKDTSVYNQPKWQALTSALTEALQSDNMVNNPQMSVGLIMFPGPQVELDCVDNCCDLAEPSISVDIGRAANTVDSIINALGDTGPGGLTPTSAALDQALAYFQTGPGADLDGDKYVLLATDGGPNCNDSLQCGNDECTLFLDGQCNGSDDCCGDEGTRSWCVDWSDTQAKIADLASAGVKTIVVGIPGSERYKDWLNAFADAGQAVAPSASEDGGAHYYEVAASGGVGALTKTFEDITISLVRSCRIQLSETPPSTSDWLVNVAIDCTAIPKGGQKIEGAAGAGSEERTPVNWLVDTSTDPPTVELLDKQCDRVKRGVDRLDIIVGCPPRL